VVALDDEAADRVPGERWKLDDLAGEQVTERGPQKPSGCADVALPRGRAAGPRHSLPEGTCRCRRSEHRRRPACAPAPSNACAPVSARASRPSKSLAIKAVRLAPFDFFDCFSKRAHLRRPGGANPLDPSADQGSVDRQDHGGNPAFRGTRVPVHRLAELVPSRVRACARVAEGKCSRRGERLAPAPAE
jgi:hypothetical protein